jgi:hypothetical protein
MLKMLALSCHRNFNLKTHVLTDEFKNARSVADEGAAILKTLQQLICSIHS